jgi:hypothetical protein
MNRRRLAFTSASRKSHGALAVEAVERHVARRALQRRARRIDRGHALRAAPARQRRDGEAAGVAKAVEHALQAQPRASSAEALAAVALVEVEAGLVAGRDVQRQPPVVLADRDSVAPSPRSQPVTGRPFELAAAGVRALVELGQGRSP